MTIESDLVTLNNILKVHRKSTTIARIEVFKCLWHQPPLSMKELEVRINSRIDRASIYRVVELFIEIGIAKKIYQGWKYRIELGEQFRPHHHHIRCNKCGKSYDFDEPGELDEIIENITKKYGFRATGHQFEIDGLCAKCQA